MRFPDRRALALAALAALASSIAAPLAAQQPAPSGTQPAAKASTAASEPVQISGVLYPYFVYGGEKGARSSNRFDVERAYLNFRANLAERTSIRVTGDLYQNASAGSYYGGWTLRAKYAWLQYDYLAPRPSGLAATARLGLLTTVLIDHEEQFWPRWIAQTAVERTGFFSSADAGAATLVTLPGKMGEVYATVTNGNGYTQPETDRYKDYAARLTITPFAARAGLLRTFTISPWAYKGTYAITGLTQGQRRDRWGVFAGLRDPRLYAGVEYAQRTTAVDTITGAPVGASDETVKLLSGFAWLKPFQTAAGDGTSPLSPLGAVVRYDSPDYSGASNITTSNLVNGHLWIAGLTYDLNKRVSLSLDYQEQAPRAAGTLAQGKDLRSYYLHAVASF